MPVERLHGARHAVTLHGNDLWHPRSNRITRAVLPLLDLVATVSADLADDYLPGAGERRRSWTPLS